MILICAMIVICACILYIGGAPIISSYRKDRKQLKAGADWDGLPLKYNPHHTRSIEIEQGLNGRLTQCDDTSCQTCYWKAGKEQRAKMLPTTRLIEDFCKWNDELPDGLSDELYESMYEDWLQSSAVVNLLNNYNSINERREQLKYGELCSTSSESYKSKYVSRDEYTRLITDDDIQYIITDGNGREIKAVSRKAPSIKTETKWR